MKHCELFFKNLQFLESINLVCAQNFFTKTNGNFSVKFIFVYKICFKYV